MLPGRCRAPAARVGHAGPLLTRDVVLIHSTGQGAAGWERVVRALGERGRTAHAVELTSDPGLLAADHAERIRRQVGAVAAPVVLAHSGSGPLLPAAARALRASHQIWLAAWVPDPEASFVEDTNRHLRAAFHPGWIGKDPTEDDAAAAAFLYHDADEATLEWALSTRRMARERLGVEPVELASGHCPNVSQPGRLAALLVEVASRDVDTRPPARQSPPQEGTF